MRSARGLVLSLACSVSASAANLPSFELGNLLGGPLNSESSSAPSLQIFIVNAGLNDAKSDPKYAAILTALGINNAADLQKFLQRDSSGANFKDIIVHTAYQYAFTHQQYAEWLSSVGVTDEASLNAFLNAKGKDYQDLIYSMALAYAKKNPQYSEWLSLMEISDISDIAEILSGGLQRSNLQDFILSSALRSFQKISKYAPDISLATLLLGGNSLNTYDPSSLFLGAFDGLPVSEIKNIHFSKSIRTRAKT